MNRNSRWQRSRIGQRTKDDVWRRGSHRENGHVGRSAREKSMADRAAGAVHDGVSRFAQSLDLPVPEWI